MNEKKFCLFPHVVQAASSMLVVLELRVPASTSGGKKKTKQNKTGQRKRKLFFFGPASTRAQEKRVFQVLLSLMAMERKSFHCFQSKGLFEQKTKTKTQTLKKNPPPFLSFARSCDWFLYAAERGRSGQKEKKAKRNETKRI